MTVFNLDYKMENKVLIIYSSVDGQTRKICNAIRSELEASGCEVAMYEAHLFSGRLEDYHLAVVGSSIRYGVHHKAILDFIANNREQLDRMKTAFFSVNLVARKPEKNSPETNPYVVKFFKGITWRPTLVEVFAGKLDYKKYPFFDRIMIQLIMWMTKGPTDPTVEIEYTDWGRVKSFAGKVTKL